MLVSYLSGRARIGERLLTVARAGGLGSVLWGVSQQERPGLGGAHLAVLALMICCALSWAAWMSARRLRLGSGVTTGALATLAATGGALAAIAPIAMTFPAVAALGAGLALPSSLSTVVAAAGGASVLIAGIASNAPAGFVVSGVLATAAGLMAGRSRRQYTERAEQAEALLAERTRADAERDRAAALAERNRIAREIHDVLAHSLGALAVQLDAADAVLEDSGDRDRARQLVRQARTLAVQGLTETRQAVHALRDEPVALVEQLTALAAQDGAALDVTGEPHALDPAAGVALYRAAQEAITNARKHAPGAPVSIRVEFAVGRTSLTVTNGPSSKEIGSPTLADTGGGYGLAGMRERVELLGGSLSAAPEGAGFAVRVAIPG
ncbi:MAG TPA: histidine kinase [Acidimicrobiales bacterium]|nr:histidine kinase [Acidimicrobiales bacterium]